MRRSASPFLAAAESSCAQSHRLASALSSLQTETSNKATAFKTDASTVMTRRTEIAAAKAPEGSVVLRTSGEGTRSEGSAAAHAIVAPKPVPYRRQILRRRLEHVRGNKGGDERPKQCTECIPPLADQYREVDDRAPLVGIGKDELANALQSTGAQA